MMEQRSSLFEVRVPSRPYQSPMPEGWLDEVRREGLFIPGGKVNSRHWPDGTIITTDCFFYPIPVESLALEVDKKQRSSWRGCMIERAKDQDGRPVARQWHECKHHCSQIIWPT